MFPALARSICTKYGKSVGWIYFGGKVLWPVIMSMTSDLHSGCSDGPPLSVSVAVIFFVVVFRLLAIDRRFGFESRLNHSGGYEFLIDSIAFKLEVFVPG